MQRSADASTRGFECVEVARNGTSYLRSGDLQRGGCILAETWKLHMQDHDFPTQFVAAVLRRGSVRFDGTGLE